jgi:hypothetical protein
VFSAARRTIKQLRLIDMPIFRTGMVRDVLDMATCLEMDFGMFEDFRFCLRDMKELLRLVPNLLEFGMRERSSALDITPTFGAQDLVSQFYLTYIVNIMGRSRPVTQLDFLAVLDESSHSRAVWFFDFLKTSSELPETLLENMGDIPSSLRYIKWEVHPD